MSRIRLADSTHDELRAQYLDAHVMRPALAGAVGRCVLVGEDPEADRPAADLPAGRIDVLGGTRPGRLDRPFIAGPVQPPQATRASDQAAEATATPVRVSRTEEHLR